MGAFDNFSEVPVEKQDESLQSLFLYEKQYMELVSLHKTEIDFLEGKLQDLRAEQKDFFEEKIPEISKKLDDEGIDKETKNEWLKHLEDTMQKSFEFSTNLLNSFAIMQIEEFKKKAEKLIFEKV